jgi:hypothetical protein
VFPSQKKTLHRVLKLICWRVDQVPLFARVFRVCQAEIKEVGILTVQICCKWEVGTHSKPSSQPTTSRLKLLVQRPETQRNRFSRLFFSLFVID